MREDIGTVNPLLGFLEWKTRILDGVLARLDKLSKRTVASRDEEREWRGGGVGNRRQRGASTKTVVQCGIGQPCGLHAWSVLA